MRQKNYGMLMIIFMLSTVLSAQSITTQGVLRDGSGHSVADDTYTMTFRIYDDELSGNMVWDETLTDVEVLNGVYNVILGETTTMDVLNSSGTYWMSVEVGSDGEMSPRLRMAPTPYELAVVSGDKNIFPGTGNVGIGTTSPQGNLHIANPIDVSPTGGGLTLGNSAIGMFLDDNEIQTTGNLYINKDNDGTLYINNGGGKVGIGTSSPGGRLDIYAEGDALESEHAVHALELNGDDQIMYMGVNSTDHIAYIQSVDYGTSVSTLVFNARGGNVGIGTTAPEANLEIKSSSGTKLKITNPQDVNATNGALIIGDPAGTALLLDNNEIQATNGLLINNDINSNININAGGGTLNIKGPILVGDEAPFKIRRYTVSNTENWEKDTGYTFAKWSAVVVGWGSGTCDINENGDETSWKVLMIKKTEADGDIEWYISAGAPTHNNSPDWTVDVMFIRKYMTDDTRY